MKNITKFNLENGYYLFKLKNILNKQNISINKLMKDRNTDFKVIKRLITEELVKIDIFTLWLSRLFYWRYS